MHRVFSTLPPPPARRFFSKLSNFRSILAAHSYTFLLALYSRFASIPVIFPAISPSRPLSRPFDLSEIGSSKAPFVRGRGREKEKRTRVGTPARVHRLNLPRIVPILVCAGVGAGARVSAPPRVRCIRARAHTPRPPACARHTFRASGVTAYFSYPKRARGYETRTT